MRAASLLGLLAGFANAALTVLEPPAKGGVAAGEEMIYRQPKLPGHTLRIRKTNEEVCAGNEGIAGFLDIEEGDKHLSFWAFESRNNPAQDPVILWMTGGPGCASIGVGMLIELGPCLVRDSETTTFNPYSWNSNATIIFVDQPANVGYSYSDNLVRNNFDATTDMHHFLSIFFSHFHALSTRDFYIAGESYGGTWVPTLAARILERQTSLMSQIAFSTAASLNSHINLRGIMLGNAQVAQRDQWKGFYDTACLGEKPLFNESACAVMQKAAARCEELLEVCNAADYDPALSAPILQYCRERSVFMIQDTGKNPYDIRRDCENDVDGYNIMGIAAQYMERDLVRKQLGVEGKKKYQQCNSQFTSDFTQSGDNGRETSKYVTYLLNEGIDVLVYVGNKDWYCNAPSMRYFVNSLVWDGLAGFRSEVERPWNAEGKQAGSFKQWSHLTFLEVFDAGHMVPMDQPIVALQMVNRWVNETRKIF